ncbi:LexA family transcriptional regulator [Chryseobacterium nematophagum]|uniref:LexA family transcriptional regulator n=1 Tax=Chryseobacterium nematophagum TaxID=2305228 RepID=A0A3M7LI07_9FLAO|nr:LexA family transcriptional regulator [Chryseobacterium nematophagum]RMZ61246.1 LexA family transcriptional regulator [Chryseobacterium nematophagum]RMZ61316.1 LexA family transcriptional regulator [Chryseobacterium nematophagum]
MSIFSENIRFLRGKRELSQQSIADSLIITRSRYASYEDGRVEPPIELLIKISKFFHLSIDMLLTVDLRKYPLEQMLNLPENRILLPIIVNSQDENYIEIVPQKASMGYLLGYSDPEYIQGLQRMHLPFLKNGKYRGFLADGDSMPPFANGSYVIGEYVENLQDLKTNKQYIFITEEGITFKTFLEKNEHAIRVSADNPFYPQYEIGLEKIIEVWKYVRGILPTEYKPDEQHYIREMFLQLKKEIRDLKK